MSRPWHKSLLLYLGLVPLLFLFWAWADSMKHESGLQRMMTMRTAHFGADPYDSIYHHDAKITLILAEPVSARDYIITYGPIESFRGPFQGREWFPPPSKRSETVQGMVIFHNYSLPHWCLILLYLLFWSIFFRWRHRRATRSLKTAPASPGAAAHPFKN